MTWRQLVSLTSRSRCVQLHFAYTRPLASHMLLSSRGLPLKNWVNRNFEFPPLIRPPRPPDRGEANRVLPSVPAIERRSPSQYRLTAPRGTQLPFPASVRPCSPTIKPFRRRLRYRTFDRRAPRASPRVLGDIWSKTHHLWKPTHRTALLHCSPRAAICAHSRSSVYPQARFRAEETGDRGRRQYRGIPVVPGVSRPSYLLVVLKASGVERCPKGFPIAVGFVASERGGEGRDGAGSATPGNSGRLNS